MSQRVTGISAAAMEGATGRPGRGQPLYGHYQRNIGTADRVISTVGGVALMGIGLRRGLLTAPGLIAGLLGGELLRRGLTGHSMLYDRLGISTVEEGAERQLVPDQGVHVEESVTILRPREEVYHFWRNLENFPRFMSHIREVRPLGNRRSHWVARAPAGMSIEWDAEVIEDRPGELISWVSLPGSKLENRGTVHFRDAPAGRGTEVDVIMGYLPPAGQVGRVIAKLMGDDPEFAIRESLRHMKQLLETGEIPTTEGQPSGRAADRMARHAQRSQTSAMSAVAGTDRPAGHPDPFTP